MIITLEKNEEDKDRVFKVVRCGTIKDINDNDVTVPSSTQLLTKAEAAKKRLFIKEKLDEWDLIIANIEEIEGNL